MGDKPTVLFARIHTSGRNRTAARQTELLSELDRWDQHRSSSPPVPGPWAHLRHRALPLAEDGPARSRALRVWASASSGVLFAALGLFLLLGGSRLLLPTVIIVVGTLLVEAAVRRHLLALVANLMLASAVVAVVWTGFALLVRKRPPRRGVRTAAPAACMAVQTLIDAFDQRRSRRSE